jgi:hypothetical protein
MMVKLIERRRKAARPSRNDAVGVGEGGELGSPDVADILKRPRPDASPPQRLNELIASLRIAFSRRGKSVEDRRRRLILSLDAFYVFLAKLDMPGLEAAAAELDELRSALGDAQEGRQNPLTIPSPRRSNRRSTHSDPSQLWRARVNLILAIKATQALLRLDGSDHSFKVAARYVAQKLPNNFIETIATQRNRTKLNNTERDRFDYLNDMVGNWEGEIQRKRRPPTNEEAANLYSVTNDLITAYADDPLMLSIIANRCLVATKTDAAALRAV